MRVSLIVFLPILLSLFFSPILLSFFLLFIFSNIPFIYIYTLSIPFWSSLSLLFSFLLLLFFTYHYLFIMFYESWFHISSVYYTFSKLWRVAIQYSGYIVLYWAVTRTLWLTNTVVWYCPNFPYYHTYFCACAEESHMRLDRRLIPTILRYHAWLFIDAYWHSRCLGYDWQLHEFLSLILVDKTIGDLLFIYTLCGLILPSDSDCTFILIHLFDRPIWTCLALSPVCFILFYLNLIDLCPIYW